METFNPAHGMIGLLISLLERLGIFAAGFIVLMRFNAFKRLITGKATRYEKLTLSVVFGLFGIAGTYLGVPVHDAIANSRVVGVALGGILGGPLVGFSAGLIAGGHRFLIDIGGFTALACGIATIAEGCFGSLLYHKIKKERFDPQAAFIVGLAVEILQMIIILLIARPVDAAFQLVQVIAVPMILANSLGLAVFVKLVESMSKEQERFGAYQAQTALKIALRTLPILRSGLNHESATKSARIILEMTDLDAVALTDERQILAHVGAEADHHKPHTPLLTSATRHALSSGEIVVASTRDEIGCTHPSCGLGSAIIVPLKRQEKTIGALKLYRLKEQRISPLDMELANGLAHLFSNQIELAELDNQRKLAKEAEIRALQAQINPHFLFNTLNTVRSYMRTDIETARRLMVKLAEFLRKNMNPGNEDMPLSVEIEHCKTYIEIESARFDDRVRARFDVDNAALDCRVPPLILQPIVENALKHGILRKECGGELLVSARRENGALRISVADDGEGMTGATLSGLFSDQGSASGGASDSGSGIALRNINARLVALYGSRHALSVESTPQKGTVVSFTVPVH
ncbi:MAG: two-component system LytT family sensor histidine kinase LytS [Nitrospirae bacterium]|nr:MAG: two-component system LytT family sensor histidine kinase LytS [Nitrospirota bacterium]